MPILMPGSVLGVQPGRTWTHEELKEREARELRERREQLRAAQLQADIGTWIDRGLSAIIAEIERDGNRRVFLAEDGAIMVRGRGTGEHLKAALRHHERTVRDILADREAIEELIPAPEPARPAAQAAA